MTTVPHLSRPDKAPQVKPAARTREDGCWMWQNCALLSWLPSLSHAQLKVYVVLCRYADRMTSDVLIGQRTIAANAGLSDRHARRVLKALEERFSLIAFVGLRRIPGGEERVSC